MLFSERNPLSNSKICFRVKLELRGFERNRMVSELGSLRVLELWSFGALELWSFGALELWIFGPLDLWTFGLNS